MPHGSLGSRKALREELGKPLKGEDFFRVPSPVIFQTDYIWDFRKYTEAPLGFETEATFDVAGAHIKNGKGLETFHYGYSELETYVKFDTSPVAGARESAGFEEMDRAYGCAYVEILGTVFHFYSKDRFGRSQTTVLTWSDDYKTGAHRYNILWTPNFTALWIDGVRVAYHTVSPSGSLDISWSNNDSFTSEMLVLNLFLRMYTAQAFTYLFAVQPLVTLTWTNTGVNTDVAPDTDTEIDVTQASRIAIQGDTTDVSNTSTSIDINVEGTLDGINWDSVPYTEMNFGDSEVKTMLVEPGVQKIRLRVDNNAAVTTGYVTARVYVR